MIFSCPMKDNINVLKYRQQLNKMQKSAEIFLIIDNIVYPYTYSQLSLNKILNEMLILESFLIHIYDALFESFDFDTK